MQLVEGVFVADVVPALEFADVPVEVLRAHLVVDADVAALQEAPEALDTVRVRLVSHVLRDAVLDRFMGEGEGFVDQRIVGVDRRVRGPVIRDEAVKSRLVGTLDHSGGDPIRFRGP